MTSMIRWHVLMILTCSLVTGLAAGQYYNQTPEYLKANGVWAFGYNCGLDFNQGGPAVPFLTMVGPGASAIENTASVASPYSGRLLFYSDGEKCWNSNHIVMPHGSGLRGAGTLHTTTQGVCIVPVIDSPGKYYLFSLNHTNSTPSLYYSIVDTSLDNGRGDVDTNRKNILLDATPLHESMIAIPGNNCDVWLMVHSSNLSRFKAYHITRNGIDPSPVISNMGTQIQGSGAYFIGGMTVSPDRSMIAICSRSSLSSSQGLPTGGALLCQFDAATGQVTSGIVAEGSTGCYHACFSPDNSKLYILNEGTNRSLYQYDVSNYNAAAIAASKTLIKDAYNRVSLLKLYRDTIYTLMRTGSNSDKIYLNRINNPNVQGAGCGYQDSAVLLWPGSSATCLSSDVVYPIPFDTVYARRLDTLLCFYPGDSVTLSASPGFAGYEWDDGSTDSTRVITATGVYYAYCKDYCRPRVDSFIIRDPDTLFFMHDTCAVPPLVLHGQDGYTTYLWQDGTKTMEYTVVSPGTYWVQASDKCSFRIDSFTVRDIDFDFSLGADTVICDKTPLRLAATVPGASYLWQDGSTESAYTIHTSGSYRVQVTRNGCMLSDTIQVRYADVRQHLGDDIMVCKNEPVQITLQANVPPGATALWNDGTEGPVAYVADSGTYWVMVSDPPCTGSDTIIIRQEFCSCRISIPDAFTPNGDGKNDYFRPLIEPGCPVQDYRLNIYNRYGQRIYTTNDPTSGWDGIYNGSPATVGVYMYDLRFTGGTKNNEYYKKGDLTVIR